MGNVIQTAQGVVASLPALAIQRLNPGLYDLLQNGVLEAGQEFRVAKLQCDEVVDDMGDRLAHEGWSSVAKADFWRSQIELGGRDVVQVAEEADTSGADRGVSWVGGTPAGGDGQDPIEAVGDVAAAGYNLLLGRSAADTSAVGPAACGDSDTALLHADIERQRVEHLALSTGASVCVNGTNCTVPILAELPGGRRFAVSLSAPLTPGYPAEPSLATARPDASGLPIILANELVVRGNLAAATRGVLAQLR